MRNAEASVTLPLPVIPRSRSTVRLGFSTPAVCLRPHRYPWRPHRAGTEGTTSWLNHPFLDVQQYNLRPRVAVTPPVTASCPNETFQVHSNPQPGSDAVERVGYARHGSGRASNTSLLSRLLCQLPYNSPIHSAFTLALPYAERQGLAHSRLNLYWFSGIFRNTPQPIETSLRGRFRK